MINRRDNQIVILGCTTTGICDPPRPARCNGATVGVSRPTSYPIYPTRHLLRFGAIPNLATEKEPKRNFLYLTDVTLVVVDIKSERFIKRPTSYPIYPTRHVLRFAVVLLHFETGMNWTRPPSGFSPFRIEVFFLLRIINVP